MDVTEGNKRNLISKSVFLDRNNKEVKSLKGEERVYRIGDTEKAVVEGEAYYTNGLGVRRAIQLAISGHIDYSSPTLKDFSETHDIDESGVSTYINKNNPLLAKLMGELLAACSATLTIETDTVKLVVRPISQMPVA